ncbi:unnamed protein product [Caretta caretta]
MIQRRLTDYLCETLDKSVTLPLPQFPHLKDFRDVVLIKEWMLVQLLEDALGGSAALCDLCMVESLQQLEVGREPG